MKLKVKCEFVIEVEVPDDPEFDATFYIEDNNCPGTGIVGAALDAHIAACDSKGTCWACALDGTCKILPAIKEHKSASGIDRITQRINSHIKRTPTPRFTLTDDPLQIRTPEGRINNCALAFGKPEDTCQVCRGRCPDRAFFGHSDDKNDEDEDDASRCSSIVP